jgi:hypothetical protein
MGQSASTILGTDGPSSIIDNLNNLVATGAQAVACGPSCQAEKLTASYYQAYIQAQQTLNTAPENLDVAYKNYIVNSQGQAAYDQIVQDALTKQANDISIKLQKNFDESMKDAVALNDAYNATVYNFNNSNELYQDYVVTNKELKHRIDDASNDIYTNDRKSYYNSQEISGLTTWHSVFRFIYIIVLVCFLLCILFVKSENKVVTNVLILVGLVIYPFICTPLTLYLIGVLQWIWSFFPKNVYMSDGPNRIPGTQRDDVDKSLIPPAKTQGKDYKVTQGQASPQFPVSLFLS